MDNIHPHMLRHSFATHLWPAARICVSSRNCWGMPTSHHTDHTLWTEADSSRLSPPIIKAVIRG